MKKVYVLGGEQTDFQRNWRKEEKSVLAMFREVTEDSFQEVKIEYKEIERLSKENKVAIFVGNFAGELYLKQGHMGAFLTEVNPCFYGVPSARYEAACASSSTAIDAAMAKIENDTYDLAIVLGIEMMKTVDAKTGGDFLGTAAYYEKEAKGVDFPFPKLFSQLAAALIKKYELDTDRFMSNLAEIATINYENAKRNPKAQTRNWFMEKKQACSRGLNTNNIVAGNLAITDCSQVTDGAALVFLASEEYTRQYCAKHKIAIKDIPYIKGWGHRVAPFLFNKKIEDSKETEHILKWTRQAIVDAYQRASLTVEDIDFFETHDCFTSSEYAAISAFGITKPGQEYQAIESDRIAFKGDKPINPSGGLIGCGHPVGASGARMLLDLYKQIAKKAGSYQLEEPSNGMMLNIGGSATSNYVFIVGK